MKSKTHSTYTGVEEGEPWEGLALMSEQVKGVGSGGRSRGGVSREDRLVGKNNMGRAGTHIQRDRREWRTAGLRRG